MAEDIKQDTESQRAKPNPAPRDRGNGISEITDKLRDGTVNVDSKTLNDGLVNIAKNIHTFGIQANAKLDSLSVSMSGNKLKELETNKEGIARTDKTNELLGKLLEKELVIPDAPKGWFGKALALFGALSGAVAGLVVGFALGIGDTLLLITKGLKNSLLKVGSFIAFLGRTFTKLKQSPKIIKTIAFITRRIDNLMDFIKLIGNKFSFLRSGTYRTEYLFKRLKDGFKVAVATIKGIVSTVKGLGETAYIYALIIGDKLKAANKTATGFGTKFKGVITTVLKPFNFIIKAFKDAFKPIASVLKTITGTGKSVKSFGLIAKGFFRPLSTFFKFAFAVFKPIGRLFGRLFFPLTIIMGVIDGVKGAIDGVANNKEGSNFVAGMFGALKGILKGVVGIPLDMLKNGVAWLMTKFGVDSDIVDMVGNFSFSDQIGKMVDGLKAFTTKIIDFFVGMFSIVDFGSGGLLGKAFTGMGNLLKRMVRPMLKALLPVDGEGKVSALAKSLALKMPGMDSLYDWAGLDSKTGLMKDFVGPPNVKVKANGVNGDDLMAESVEAAAARNGNNKGVNQVEVINASTNTQSSNSSVNVTGNVFENRRRGNRGAVFG